MSTFLTFFFFFFGSSSLIILFHPLVTFFSRKNWIKTRIENSFKKLFIYWLIEVEFFGSLGDALERYNNFTIWRCKEVFCFSSIGQYFRISKLRITVGDKVDKWRPDVCWFWCNDWCSHDCCFRLIRYFTWNMNACIAQIYFSSPHVCSIEAQDYLWPFKKLF